MQLPISDDEFDRTLLERVDQRIAELAADLKLFQQLRARLTETDSEEVKAPDEE